MTTASKTAVRIAASAISAALFTNLALAATPTAVWDGAVSGLGLDTTQAGLAFAYSGDVAVSAANITICPTGGAQYSGARIDLSSLAISKATVLVKFSGFAKQSGHGIFTPVFMAARDNDRHEVGVRAVDDATAFLYYWIEYSETGNTLANGSTTAGDSFCDAAGNVKLTSGYALFSYDRDGGVSLATGTSPANLAGSSVTGYKFSNKSQTLTQISVGGAPDFSFYDGWKGLVIEKVALFAGEKLAAGDVADYKFPSEANMITADTTVSAINDLFGDAGEIDVYLADGVTVTGDTTFNASKVNFFCAGSFMIAPPAGNTAVFSFAGVTGRPAIAYSGALPVANGNVFSSNTFPTWVTDASQWTGTIWISDVAVQNFDPNSYGNASSAVRLSNVSGYFPKTLDCTVPVELKNGSSGYGMLLNNGYSRDTATSPHLITIRSLRGDGELWTSGSAPNVLINVRGFSEFAGKIQLANKTVVFGDYVPPYSEFNTAGAIYVGAGAEVALPADMQWRADGGIHVHGVFRATDIGESQLRADTTVTTYDGGTFALVNATNVNEQVLDYARVTGSGTLRLEGIGSSWRILSRVNFPSTMTLENEVGGGLIVPLPSDGAVNTIGSLSGSGNLRSDWNNGNRDLKILQAKDTTWSGVFANTDRIGTVIVAPGGDSAGTLTLSGTQTSENSLSVESGAKVRIAGTWVGAATVSGTIGGTGSLAGAMTLGDGATLDVPDLSKLLVADGLVATGAVNVTLPEGTSRASRKILAVDGEIDISGASFAVYIGDVKQPLRIMKTTGGLKVAAEGTIIRLR